MQQVKIGDTVKVHYHGRLPDGTTFDSSQGRAPLEFKVGSGAVIKGFDEGVMGMQVGDKKTLEIPAHEAYGVSEPDRVVEFPRNQLPKDIEPEVGMQLHMSSPKGDAIPVVITAVKDDVIVLDANHPLAGKDLIFDIELVGIAGSSPLIITP